MTSKAYNPRALMLLRGAAAAALTAGAYLFSATAGLAQAAPSAPHAKTSGAPQIQEIVVTAQKRVERLQDVPISVEAVGGAQIQNQAISSLSQMTDHLPAVVVAKGASGDRLSIRGVGSADNIALFEQGVGTFVDEIYHGRSRSSESQFLDLDRVEVLKGPQNTYFGNNAIAGAISIATRNPGSTPGGFVRALYNLDLHDTQVEAAFGGPINDQFAVRVAGLASGGDGWMNDITGHVKVPKTSNRDGRITAVWTPNDRLSVNLKASFADEHETGGFPQKMVFCPPSADFPGPKGFCAASIGQHEDTSFNYTRSNSPGQGSVYKSQEYVSTIKYDAGAVDLTSVTGFWHYKFNLNLDVDATELSLLEARLPEDYNQFSQEFRVASKATGPVEYMAGVYYQYDKIKGSTQFSYESFNPVISGNPTYAALVPYLPFGTSDDYVQSTNTYSAFGSLTWHLNDRLKATFGARAIQVNKSFEQDTYFGTATDLYHTGVIPFPSGLVALGNAFGVSKGLGAPFPRPASLKASHVGPSVNVEYKLSPNAMAYASYANGFLAGGFNPSDHTGLASALSFGPETVDSFEVGAKAQWLNRRLTTNVSLFYEKFKGLQISSPENTGSAIITVVRNVGGAVAQGIDFNGRFVLDDHWSTGLTMELLDSHFVDYKNGPPTPLQTIHGLVMQDLSGKPTRYAPHYSGDFNLAYATDLGADLRLRAEADVYFTAHYNLNNTNDPLLERAGYTRLDMTVNLASTKQNWDLSLIGKNLTNQMVVTSGTSQPTAAGTYVYQFAAPRNIALQLKYKF